jgi:hypothetical protein
MPTKPLDKRTALAVLDVVEGALRVEAAQQVLLGRECYADGFDDAALWVRTFREQVASGRLSADYHPLHVVLARGEALDIRCGKMLSAEFENDRQVLPVRECRLPLDHDGKCR